MINKSYKPLVTIITPVFNGANLIEKCYESIIKQDYKNIEWVIVDDGSTDNSKEVIEGLQTIKAVPIKYIYQKNKGAFTARENAISCAKGLYIVNVDCDDYLSRDAVSMAMSKILNNDEIDFVLFNLYFIDLDGTNANLFNYLENQWPIRGDEALSQCVSEWKIHGLGAVKKEVYLKAYALLGKESHNNVNTDELLTRYLFHFCNMVDVCHGTYFYVNNMSSTTKSINSNAYKVIYNAIKLNEFIGKNYSDLNNDAQNNLLSTAWTICHGFLKNYSELQNKNDWINAVTLANNHINFEKLKPSKDIDIKSKLKFYIKILIVKTFACLGR